MLAIPLLARAATCMAVAAALGRGPVPAPTAVDEASTAVDGSDRGIVVLRPRVSGDAPARVRDDVAAAVIAGLGRGTTKIVRADPADDGCSEAACRRAIAARAGMPRVLEITVTVSRRDYETRLVLYDGASGDEIAALTRSCELCGLAEVTELIDSQAANLLRRLEGPSQAATLVVRSVPTGATVRVDHDAVGRTPITRELAPGPHVVVLDLDGHVSERRSITAVAGVRETLAIELSTLPRRSDRVRAGAIAALVAGAVVAGIGGALIGIHGHPNRTACSGTDVDADGDCRYLYATRPAGIGMVAVGGAAIIGGVVMAVIARRRAR